MNWNFRLIETTDDIFGTVAAKIAEVTKVVEKLHLTLERIWNNFPDLPPIESATNSKFLLDSLWREIKDIDNLDRRVLKHFNENPDDVADIKTMARKELFRLPTVLLLYYLAKKNPRRFGKFDALTREEKEDLGALIGVMLD